MILPFNTLLRFETSSTENSLVPSVINWHEMATTMAANATSTSANGAHYSSDLVNMAESSMELSKRFAQMQLKSATCTPKRQPTIVCEEIADQDELIQEDEHKPTPNKVDSLLLRSASSASLSVPVVCENEIVEKRRPPLPEHVDLNH